MLRAAGPHRVTANHPEHGSASVTVEIEGQDPVAVELRLERSEQTLARVTGTVVDDAGLPVDGARLGLSGPGHRPSVASAADGTFGSEELEVAFDAEVVLDLRPGE